MADLGWVWVGTLLKGLVGARRPDLAVCIAGASTRHFSLAKGPTWGRRGGNHDFLENNNTRLDALTPIIDSLKNDNIVYLKNRGVYEDENVNWCVYSLVEHNIPPDILKSDKKNIGLFHGPVRGLKTNLGYIFEDHEFTTDKFKGCDLVLCGDIHTRQVFDIPNGKKAYMVGSTIQQNFGETISKHGYGVYDLEKDEYSFVDLPNPKPFLSFYIDSIDALVDGTEKLVNY